MAGEHAAREQSRRDMLRARKSYRDRCEAAVEGIRELIQEGWMVSVCVKEIISRVGPKPGKAKP